MLNGLISAIRTLTTLPVPGKEAKALSQALPWFPLVGGMLGAVLWAAGMGLDHLLNGWSQGTGAVLVLLGVVLTRGLHLDGLADWFDGLGGGKSPDRILAIMKDSHVGAFGVLALIVVLLLKWVAISVLVENHGMACIVTAHVISRTAMAGLAAVLPYARIEGGTGAPFVKGADPGQGYLAMGLALILVLTVNGPAGGILLFAGILMTGMLGGWFSRRIKGITGDTLGAGSEMVETGVLFFCAGGFHYVEMLTSWKVLVN